MTDSPRSSLWLDRPRRDAASYPPLIEDLTVDVAIVGGGIVGASVAMVLAAKGQRVALLEAQQLAGGATGNSTAKATLHTGSNFRGLIDTLGEEQARLAVDADRAGLDFIRKWAADLDLGDAVRSVPSWAYTSTEEGRRELELEREAAASLGVEAWWADAEELVFGTHALGVADQLLIEPKLLVEAFVARAVEHGARVHEHSRVRDVHAAGDTIELTLDTDITVTATSVVLATQLPIADRSMVFAASEYRRSHVVALTADDAFERAPHMYTGIDSGALSVRPAQLTDGSGSVFVVAGNGHALDEDEDGTHVDTLADDARALTGGGELARAWITHDVFPSDGRPFVGPIRANEHIYIATGFGGWGLARGAAAALAISGHILRGHDRWEHPFDAQRLGAFLKPAAIKEGIHDAGKLVLDRLSTNPTTAIDQLEQGHGTVVHHGGRSVAVARDEAGELHAVSATCTHLGCLVHHDAERACWQCPCHGSRFTLQGEVLQGPATKPLEQLDVDALR
ncbi:MAG: [Fe-S]-binding protein [Thermoleophilia bacterium]|nr:[Fe-S]-binding protein [Thermoleophilia bacterium]